jgi:hypothetical protein
LAAGRHLLNHGCEVIAYVVGKERQLGHIVKQQQAYLRASGGHIIRNIKGKWSKSTD